ncbi:heparinase II/III family protein [Nonomuraea sp. NPDC050783]|uniref:heparinase II/III family protein n=1 Tax=Nonomuraea sp. NPDC050783 TaxID=3154634 RepID=UPI003467236E
MEWTRSPGAHNVPVVTGAAFRPGTSTDLLRSVIEPGRQSFELADDAYGVRRTRHVLVHHGPAELMAVHDSVPAGTLRSLWHFDPALAVVSREAGVVVLGDGSGFRVTLPQFPGEGQGIRPGMVSPGYLRTAEVVTVVSPAAPAVVTVIVPGTASVTASPLTVHTEGGPVTLPPPYDRPAQR